MADDLVLVTGASGYVATHVIQQLQEKGYKVRGTVRSLKREDKVKPLYDLCPDASHPLELVEAELLKEEGWAAAVQGCTYVMHVASPFPNEAPSNEDEVIKPAVDGTLSVLKACSEAGTVRRVVLTSSTVSIISGHSHGNDYVYTEKDWSNLKGKMSTYNKSKTLAERAAWDFMETLPEDKKFELTTINPGFIMGPVLAQTFGTSMEVARSIMQKEMSMVPKLHFPIADVRDVAAAHVQAMLVPDAAGHRHITTGASFWMKEYALIMKEEFEPMGYKIPTGEAPNFMIRVASLCDKSLRSITPLLGKVANVDNTRMRTVLQVEPRPIKDTIVDMCHSMIKHGMIKRTEKYTEK